MTAAGPPDGREDPAAAVEAHGELAAEQLVLDRLYARLDQILAETRARLSAALGADVADTPQGLAERDALVWHLEERLASLSGVETRLCFGRLDLRDGEHYYIGRVGLADERNEPLLLDWRAPLAAAFYQATAAAPGEVLRRRHLTTRDRRVVAIEDEALDLPALDPAARRHLVGEGALMAAVQAVRTGRMGDIVATIQAEQDRVIRSDRRGVLVVQGGPGTGKTAVALHRTAYLLYTHRDQLARTGVLLVGPSPVFLRYIERVLPALGESGVVMATPGTLFPGVDARHEDPPAVARLKGDARMVRVLERAVRARQRVPRGPVSMDVDGTPLSVPPEVFVAARQRARASRKPHNEARAIFLRHFLAELADRLLAATWAEEIAELADRELAMEALRDAPDVWRAIDRAWGLLTPQELLAELYADPRQLAMAAADLGPEEPPLLARDPESAADWTLSDVPLLDEAAEILGEDQSGARLAARQAASQRRADLAFARESLRHTGGLAAALVSAEQLADRFADAGPRRTVAEQAARDRGWAFGHVVVDEAQELSPMAWRLLLRRCPSRSMTVVGDISQTGAAAGAASWEAALGPQLGDGWRLERLTINYRTPAAVMDLAAALLAGAGIEAPPLESVREGEPPRALRLAEGDAEGLAARVATELARIDEGRMAVICPGTGPWSAAAVAAALGRRLPEGSVGQGTTAIDAPVAVLDPRECKGLEVDVVLLVEPAAIVAASPRGVNDLYVAITRPTQRLLIVHSQPLPPGMAGIRAADP